MVSYGPVRYGAVWCGKGKMKPEEAEKFVRETFRIPVDWPLVYIRGGAWKGRYEFYCYNMKFLDHGGPRVHLHFGRHEDIPESQPNLRFRYVSLELLNRNVVTLFPM